MLCPAPLYPAQPPPIRALLCTAVELKECSQLRTLSVENNRITKLVLDLRALKELHTLQLFGNLLEYLPELAPCFQLRYLSLANVRISADRAMAEWHVDVTPMASYISRAHDLAQLCSLFFRRSSGNHPLVAGALGGFPSVPPQLLPCCHSFMLPPQVS